MFLIDVNEPGKVFAITFYAVLSYCVLFNNAVINAIHAEGALNGADLFLVKYIRCESRETSHCCYGSGMYFFFGVSMMSHMNLIVEYMCM